MDSWHLNILKQGQLYLYEIAGKRENTQIIKLNSLKQQMCCVVAD